MKIGPFTFRDLGHGCCYAIGPADYMRSRGSILIWSILHGSHREEFLRESETGGGTFPTLAVWILADWAESPGKPGGRHGVNCNLSKISRLICVE